IESMGGGAPLPPDTTMVPAIALAVGSELVSSTLCPAAPDRICRMLFGPTLNPLTSICANEFAAPATLPSEMIVTGWKLEIVLPFSVAPATDSAPYGFCDTTALIATGANDALTAAAASMMPAPHNAVVHVQSFHDATASGLLIGSLLKSHAGAPVGN